MEPSDDDQRAESIWGFCDFHADHLASSGNIVPSWEHHRRGPLRLKLVQGMDNQRLTVQLEFPPILRQVVPPQQSPDVTKHSRPFRVQSQVSEIQRR